MALNYQLINTNNELKDIVDQIIQQHTTIAVDTEGDLDVFSGTTVLVQIGVPGLSYLIDIRNITDLEPLKLLMEDEVILKILQNAKYDYQILSQKYGIRIRNIYDTMLAEQLLLAGRSTIGDFGLQSIVKRYLDKPLSKGVRYRFENNPIFFTEEMLQYAAKDVSVLLELYPLQSDALVDEGLWTIALLEFALVPVVGEMELNGVLIDLKKWDELTEWFSEQRQEATNFIYKMAAEKVPQMALLEGTPLVNLNSHKQIKDLLAKFDINVPNTQAGTLRLKGHPLTDAIVKYKEYQKLISTYCKPVPDFIRKETGRIHASFNQIGAQSGRFSCREPNLQNIPIRATPKFRESFIAAPGTKLITADYSQIELRIIAEWSRDEELTKAFTSNADVHRWVASKLFKKKYDQVTKKERSTAKNMVYGMSYGMSAAGFSKRANISTDEAEALLGVFRGAFPKANKWLNLAGKATLKRKFSKTLWGRKRWFELPAYNDKQYKFRIGSIAREGRNHAVQGTGGDMLKLALIRLYDVLAPFNAKIINCIHDEIVIEVAENEAEKVAELVKDTMINAGQEILTTVPVDVELAIGHSWTK